MLERFGPGQPLDAELGDAFGKKPRGLLAGRDWHRLLGKRDGAKPSALAATQRQANRIENNFVARGDAIGKVCFNLGERDWRGGQDAALRCTAGEFGHRQERRAGERRCWVKIRPAAVRQQKRSGGGAHAAAAIFANTFGKGEGDQRAD